jgi:hypothetical protein
MAGLTLVDKREKKEKSSAKRRKEIVCCECTIVAGSAL